MAYYSYKDVCCSIPSHIKDKFIEEIGCEPDDDPNYNGDYWVLAGMWIDELESEIDRLNKELDNKNKGEI